MIMWITVGISKLSFAFWKFPEFFPQMGWPWTTSVLGILIFYVVENPHTVNSTLKTNWIDLPKGKKQKQFDRIRTQNS